MKIILDTNFILMAVRNKIDVLEELRGNEIYVLDLNLSELEKVRDGKSALEIIKAKGLKVLKSNEKYADTALFKFSKEGYAIATQDRILKQRIKKSSGKTIYIRQKKYIEIE